MSIVRFYWSCSILHQGVFLCQEEGGYGHEKMNQLQAVSNAIQGAALLKERAFVKHSQRGLEVINRRKQIIEEFQISFKQEDWEATAERQK